MSVSQSVRRWVTLSSARLSVSPSRFRHVYESIFAQAAHKDASLLSIVLRIPEAEGVPAFPKIYPRLLSLRDPGPPYSIIKGIPRNRHLSAPGAVRDLCEISFSLVKAVLQGTSCISTITIVTFISSIALICYLRATFYVHMIGLAFWPNL